MHQPELPMTEARAETIYRLLQAKPDTLQGMSKATGWGDKPTQDALLHLIVQGRASCRATGHAPLYCIKTKHRPNR